MHLRGKTAVVTGAGRGLGAAYACALAASGAAVVVNDLDPPAAEHTVEQITAAGGTALPYAGRIGPTETAEALVRTAVDAWGRLDVMVTNAGMLRDRMLWNMSDEEFDDVVEVHLRGTFTCARAAVRHMRERGEGGRLILLGSLAGQRGNIGQTNYSASKAAIAGLVRTWSMECARAGITVNGVIPVAATAMTATVPVFQKYVEGWQQRGEPLPARLRRWGFGTPEDVAGLVVFLASDAAAGITGQCIGVGGDKLALWSHPEERAVAFRDDGWDAGAIAEAWPMTVGREPRSVGVPLPEMPEP